MITLLEPQWGDDMATAWSVDQSVAPELWPDFAWIPALGVTGNRMSELVGNRRLGTNIGVIWTNSRHGWALSFDGDGDYVDLGTIPTGHPLQLAGSDGTIAVKFNKTAGGDVFQRVIDKSSAGNGADGYVIWLDDASSNEIGCAIDGAAHIFRASSAYATGQWHHLVWTWTASEFVLYVDGSDLNGAFDPTDTPTQPPNVSCGMRIGSAPAVASRDFYGQIASVMIWRRALRPAEIRPLSADHVLPFRRRSTTLSAIRRYGGVFSDIAANRMGVYEGYFGSA